MYVKSISFFYILVRGVGTAVARTGMAITLSVEGLTHELKLCMHVLNLCSMLYL